MNSVAIQTSSALDAARILQHIGGQWPMQQIPDGYVVTVGASRLYLIVDKDRDPGGSAFYIDYSDIAFLKAVLLAVADRPDVTIDNDHGTVLAGDRFAEKLRTEQSWDWRV